MFTHTYFGSNDLEKSRRFYDATMGALGHASMPFGNFVVYGGGAGPALVIGGTFNGAPASPANGHTLGLSAKTFAEVDAFHAAGLANGGTCDGPPGVRPQSPGQEYGAYLRDPDGHKLGAFAPNPEAAK